MSKPSFVAFYSFKGGVGRSMALANVAWALASQGKRVVAIDMDLEAPGLHPLFGGEVPGPGVVEYAAEYVARGECPSVDGFLRGVDVQRRGALWFMSAGRMDEDYQAQVARLQWSQLHPDKGSAPFVAGLKVALQSACKPHYVLIDARTGFSDEGGFTTHRMADQVVLVFNLTRTCVEGTVRAYRSITAERSHPSVILVASPVPPVAAEEGTLLDQRLKSAEKLMPLAVGRERPLVRVDYEPALALGDVLAVREPARYHAAARYERLRALIQASNPNEISRAVEESRRLVRDQRIDDAVAEMQRHVDRNPNDAEARLEQARLLVEVGRPRDAQRVIRPLVAEHPGDRASLLLLGQAQLALGDAEGACESLERARAAGEGSVGLYSALTRAYEAQGDFAKTTEARRGWLLALLGDLGPRAGAAEAPVAREAFVAVLAKEPAYADVDADALWAKVMGSLSLDRAQKLEIVQAAAASKVSATQARELMRILDEETARFRAVLGDELDRVQARVGWACSGATRDELVKLRSGDDMDGLLLALAASLEPPDLALAREAASLARDSAGVQFLLGEVALGSAEGADTATRIARLREAAAAYERASRLRPMFPEALYNWGVALSDLSQLFEGDRRRALLEEACQRYAAAVSVKADDHEALYNWGNALSLLSQLFEGDRRRALLEEACHRYAAAVSVKADYHEALCNWASAELELAQLAAAPDAARAHAERALDGARRASAIQPGAGDYDQACALAWLGRDDEAWPILESSIARDSTLRAHALEDPDLVALWGRRPDLRARLQEDPGGSPAPPEPSAAPLTAGRS